MAGMKAYREHIISYGAEETPSGFWDVKVTVSDNTPEKIVKNYALKDSFAGETAALSFAYTYGKRLIDRKLD